MKSTCLLLLFNLLGFALLSQSIGFTGKRFCAELNISLARSSGANAFKIQYDSYGAFETQPRIFSKQLSIHPELKLEYLVSERLSIGVTGLINQHDFIFNNYSVQQEDNYNSALTLDLYDSEYPYKKFVANQEAYKMLVYGFDFYVRIYGRRSIAPVGYYQEISLGKLYSHFLNSDGVEGIMTYYDQSHIDYTIPNKVNDFWKVGYSIGRKIIFNKGIYLNLSLSANIVFGFYREPKNNDSNAEKENSWFYHYYIGRVERKFLTNDFLIQYKIGIGKI